MQIDSNKVESDSEDIYVTASTMNKNSVALPQAMGDHSSTRVKHRSRTRKSERIHSNRFDDYRWLIYLFVSIIFIYFLLRFFIDHWPRREKNLFERFIDDLTRFFTA